MIRWFVNITSIYFAVLYTNNCSYENRKNTILIVVYWYYTLINDIYSSGQKVINSICLLFPQDVCDPNFLHGFVKKQKLDNSFFIIF